MKKKKNTIGLSLLIMLFFLTAIQGRAQKEMQPVDYVNPYIGNISHMLVPTYPTIHLPNSMLRVYPERGDYTGNTVRGLPLIVTSHRGSSAFNLSPYQGEIKDIKNVIDFGYDNEIIRPYYYSVDLDDYNIHVEYAPSHQAGIYRIQFNESGKSPFLAFNTGNGELTSKGNTISGYQKLDNDTRVYIYFETNIQPLMVGTHKGELIDSAVNTTSGHNAYFISEYPIAVKEIKARYGVSFISVEQAKKNLEREIASYDLSEVANKGREIWNSTLGKIAVKGSDENAKTVFYTSLYRIYERMICISEDGRYYSAFDKKVHNDEGIPFYTDDWIWDTHQAAHPLRVIIDSKKEVDMINSYLRMADQMERPWMPNFPEVTGDSRRMNANHGVAMVIDAYNKGLRGFDLEKAYIACKAAITEKTLAPWSSKPAGILDQFYKDHGYFPSLAKGEQETVPEVHGWEKRQPVAVTLGTVYDEWCLSLIAKALGKEKDAKYFSDRSLNYHKIFNKETKFFHPKDASGKFMEDLDYRFPPGIGGRDAYDENNAWVYRWGVQHNIADLVNMMGGKRSFVEELERMYSTPLGKGRPDFHHQFGDHTGIVGQFSMGNEPSMHIPYLYNYAGQPWRTQKRVRNLLKQWFRNDLMGIPGDEDGGGLTSFVVFSLIGFYPVTPGLPMYVIGSPTFESAKLDVGNGKTFEVLCKNYAPENKFIQSAKLNGKVLNKSWILHSDVVKGGHLELVMGKHPNKDWASSDDALPPSFRMYVK